MPVDEALLDGPHREPAAVAVRWRRRQRDNCIVVPQRVGRRAPARSDAVAIARHGQPGRIATALKSGGAARIEGDLDRRALPEVVENVGGGEHEARGDHEPSTHEPGTAGVGPS